MANRGASGLTLWQNYLGLSEVHLGWLNFISANCLGAAVGAIIGGFLADKYGRKFIFTYNLLVYMLGVLTVMFSVNYPMLLCGFLITGISVGVGVPRCRGVSVLWLSCFWVCSLHQAVICSDGWRVWHTQ